MSEQDDARPPGSAEEQARDDGAHGRYGGYTPAQGADPRYGAYGSAAPAGARPTAPGGQPAAPGAQPATPGGYGQYGGTYGPSYGAAGYGAAPAGGTGFGPPTYGGAPAPAGGQPYGGAPAYGQFGPGQGYRAPAAFAGAGRPGIVPLRPLGVGEILDGSFRAIRANPKVMFGLSLVVMAAIGLLEGLFLYLTFDTLMSTTAVPSTGQLIAQSAGTLVGFVGVYIASIVLTGLLLVSVSQSVMGRVATVPEVWAYAKGQVWRLVGLTFLLGVLAVVAVAAAVVVLALVIAAVAQTGDSGLVIGVLLGVLAVLGGTLALAFFSVRLAFAPPALMLERIGVLDSVRRSWRLTRGSFWRVLGILLLAWIIVAVISWALMIPLTLGLAFVGSDPTAYAMSMWPTIVSTVVSVLVSALTTPFMAAVLALTYIDVRMRREGLDVELARAAETA